MTLPRTLESWATCLLIATPVAIALSRAAADGMISVIAILFLVHAFHGGLLKESFSALWAKLLLVLWAYLMLRGIFTENPEAALKRAILWIRYPIFTIALVTWLLPSQITQKRLFYGLTATVTFLVIDGWLQFFTGTDILGREPYPAHGTPRLTGPYNSPIIGITLCWISFPVMLYWSLSKHLSWKIRVAGAAGALATIGLIFVSGERMALLLTLFGFGIVGLLAHGYRRYVFGLSVAIAWVIGAMAMLNPGVVERQKASTLATIQTFWESDYGLIWQSAGNIIADLPIFGAGPRQFRELCPKATYGVTDETMLKRRCNRHPHNPYLEWMLEGGIISLSLWLTTITCWLTLCWQYRHIITTDMLALGLFATLCIRLWPITSTTSFFISWSAVPFWLLMGWLIVRISNQNSSLSSK